MNYKGTVLVIDDEAKILELVKSYLEINGYLALCAKNAGEGLDIFREYEISKTPISLILLDLMLPDFSGEAACKKIREISEVPIIMLTAKVDEANIIQGLKIGADDYVCKPFSPRQLMARIDAILRRYGNSGYKRNEKRSILAYRDLSINTEEKTVKRGIEYLSLTRDEYSILELLMSRQAKIFTRDEILNAIKGEDYEVFDRAIDTHIKKLRAKIGDNSKTPKYIDTVYGMGYRLCPVT